MPHPISTSIGPGGAGMPAPRAVSLQHRIRQTLIRWWDRQCQHAERKDRVVPRY